MKPSERFEELIRHDRSDENAIVAGLKILDEMAELETKRFEFVLEMIATSRGLMFRKEQLEQLKVYRDLAVERGLL